MRRLKWLLLIAGMGIGFPSLAQERKEFKVRKGEIATAVIPIEDQFRFPEFKKGTIFFYNGNAFPNWLNYNYLYEEMQFINQNGDTLSAVDTRIKEVTIDASIFYKHPKHGYLEFLVTHPKIKLARKKCLKIILDEYPQPSGADPSVGGNLHGPAGDIDDEISYTYREVFTRKALGRLVIATQHAYFFADKNNRIAPASKKSISKIFPRFKKEILACLKENPVDFDVEADLIRF